MALNQSASQTSTHEGWVASGAVDGSTGGINSPDKILKGTCTHTRSSDSNAHWTLVFHRPVLPTSFVIHNRINRDRDGTFFRWHTYFIMNKLSKSIERQTFSTSANLAGSTPLIKISRNIGEVYLEAYQDKLATACMEN